PWRCAIVNSVSPGRTRYSLPRTNNVAGTEERAVSGGSGTGRHSLRSPCADTADAVRPTVAPEMAGGLSCTGGGGLTGVRITGTGGGSTGKLTWATRGGSTGFGRVGIGVATSAALV